MVKLDFPRYNGEEDTKSWTFRVEQFFEFHQTPEEEWIALASFHLEEEAQLWYQLYKQGVGVISWAAFCKGLHARFGPTPFQDFFGELAKLQQTGSVREYQSKFERVLSKVGLLSSNRQVSCFVSGLRDSIKVDVLVVQPSTLASAISLARLYEAKIMSQRHTVSQLESRKPITSNKDSKSGINPLPIKRLTANEMHERRSKGLCYNYNECFIPVHRCKKLFLIEGCDAEEEEEELPPEQDAFGAVEGVPEISLHAICGVRALETMRITGRLLRVVVTIQVDFGSTHNFLSLKLEKKVRLSPTHHQPFEVMIASGDKIASPGVCKDVTLVVQGVQIKVDFYLLALGGYEVVLGTNWLCSLGPITWDFSNLVMKHKVAGEVVVLKGMTTGRDKMVENPTRETRKSKQGLLLQLCSTISLTWHEEKKMVVEPLQQILISYGDVFAEPQGLPPVRGHDHRIPLKANSQPICV
ncbi:uncharacterized protein LOC122078063 [Macadamia integrifolia]|uniref:uncharacterized protein LOC122078063 n=1 Tax=Macadamia integrifolia TaxID=60698 RepID=UPI001C4E9C83|nr:uncharacterized protein LOC122078063 [Macadamia integrifolia]